MRSVMATFATRRLLHSNTMSGDARVLGVKLALGLSH